MNRYLLPCATISALLLAACQPDADTQKASAASGSTTASAAMQSVSAPAASSAMPQAAALPDQSPTIRAMAATLRTGVMAFLDKEKGGAISESEGKCLLHADGKQAFVDAAKANLAGKLDAATLKEADTFYDTAVGKKMLAYLEQAFETGKPPTKQLVLSEADKAELAKFHQSDIGKRLAEANTTDNPDATIAQLNALVAQEKQRCGIK